MSTEEEGLMSDKYDKEKSFRAGNRDRYERLERGGGKWHVEREQTKADKDVRRGEGPTHGRIRGNHNR